MRHPLRRSLPGASALAVAGLMLLTGCGDDAGALTGVWTEEGVQSNSSITIYKDKKVQVVTQSLTCTGTAVDQGDDVYRADLDCGSKKFMLTFKSTGPDTMDVTLGTKTARHRKKSS